MGKYNVIGGGRKEVPFQEAGEHTKKKNPGEGMSLGIKRD